MAHVQVCPTCEGAWIKALEEDATLMQKFLANFIGEACSDCDQGLVVKQDDGSFIPYSNPLPNVVYLKGEHHPYTEL